MKYLITLAMASMLIATDAGADQFEYDFEVNGMVCAYCAYSVSKQLKTLDGVDPESVDVDLDKGRVKLRSENKLDRTQLADLLLQAGFELGAVTETAALISRPRRKLDGAVFLSVTMDSDRLSNGQFDAVLEAIGEIAVKRSGRVSVIGPTELEVAILKPVLAGRRTVIEVDFDRINRPGQAIVLSLSVNSAQTH